MKNITKYAYENLDNILLKFIIYFLFDMFYKLFIIFKGEVNV